MLEIAVLGAGRIGRIHAGNIAAHPGARLAGIADTVPDAAARLAETLGTRTLTIEDAMRADAVLIASPTPTHADYIERAAGASPPGVLREADRSVGGPGARLPGRRARRPASC